MLLGDCGCNFTRKWIGIGKQMCVCVRALSSPDDPRNCHPRCKGMEDPRSSMDDKRVLPLQRGNLLASSPTEYVENPIKGEKRERVKPSHTNTHERREQNEKLQAASQPCRHIYDVGWGAYFNALAGVQAVLLYQAVGTTTPSEEQGSVHLCGWLGVASHPTQANRIYI
jgi:hypothetical protein